MSDLIQAFAKRRTRYGIDKASKLSNEEVLNLVKETVKVVPSAFNSQTQRVVVLFGEESDKFWDITREELRKVAPAEGFERTIAKLQGFAAGQGTILYYFDSATVENLQKQFTLYADNFPVWAQQENGMLQFAIWNVLAEAGIGASLQHYNPVVDEAVAKAFNIPSAWKLVAQMPFGNPTDTVEPKEMMLIDERVRSF